MIITSYKEIAFLIIVLVEDINNFFWVYGRNEGNKW